LAAASASATGAGNGNAASAGAAAAGRARDLAASGAALFREGQYRAAMARYAEALRMDPSRAENHFGLAAAALRADQRSLVEPHLLEAARLKPEYAAAQDGLGQWYVLAGDLAKALHHSAAAIRMEPQNNDFAIGRAFVLNAAGRPGEAWAVIEPLLARGNADPQAAVLYAQLAQRLEPRREHQERAATELERVLGRPDLPANGRPALHFAAATLFDRLGRYDDAFAQARAGNAASRRPHDAAAHADWVSRQIRYFTPERLASLPRASHGNRRPLFIVGVPRSGTSLVEQILDSHPSVAGRGELRALGRIAGTLDAADGPAGAYPESLESISVRRANRLAGDYLALLEGGVDPAKAGTARYVTDKMPANLFGLGLAEVLLPGSRVIHCIRNPLDTCLSCYMTYFAFGNEFSADLSHLGAYYRDCRRMMEHWRRVLGLRILDVRYEDVVLDAEGQTRRMLEFLDLPWDDRCLRFHENPRRVGTASNEQVRRPLYASSIGRWKHYEHHLGDLIAALGGPASHKD
jgi:Flp pilus assembly protein TadD